MTPKENLLQVLNWGTPEYVPLSGQCILPVGMPILNMIEMPLRQSGYDMFGVHWLVNSAGSMHDTSKLTFEDINDWKKYVKFPDLDAMDFTPFAEAELSRIDRSQFMLAYFGCAGIYERLAAFMGFENMFIAFMEEPEACKEYFDAMADWKIKLFRKIHEAYHLDIYTYFDDIATARGLFMSLDVYRNLIKPYQKKIADAVRAEGVIFEMHCCGKCEDALEDFVDLGATMWHSAQSMNDLAAIQKAFKGRLVIEGGWDSEGSCSHITATEDDLRKEVRRNMEEYGKNGGFILCPVLLNERGNSLLNGDDRMPALYDEYEKTKYCIR